MEIDLLDRYPRSRRPITERARVITDEVRAVARRYGPEFFDGDRLHGYGGYRYDGRWRPIAERFRDHYRLAPDAAILDVGCAKGFFLNDFLELMPRARVWGLDVSTYALETAMPSVAGRLVRGSADRLPFPDDSFDLVVSINTIHNLPPERCRVALQELERVSRRSTFVTVDAWRDEDERQRLLAWMLTAETYQHVDDWKRFFADAGYRGDYFWFFP